MWGLLGRLPSSASLLAKVAAPGSVHWEEVPCLEVFRPDLLSFLGRLFVFFLSFIFATQCSMWNLSSLTRD